MIIGKDHLIKDINVSRHITKIGNRIRHRFDAVFAGTELTGTQAAILHFVIETSRNRDVFPKDIEEEFSIRRSSITNVLQGLEKHGYIRRISVSTDARLKKIVLTQKAKLFETDGMPHFSCKEIDENLLSGFTPKEISMLNDFLTRMSRNMS